MDTTATPAACTYVGEPGIQARRLCEVTYECMWRGIEEIRPGSTWATSVMRSSSFAERHGYSVVREFCGHGIGAQIP